MDKSNLELFKQAVSEGLSKRFDNVADSYTEEIECSEKHKLTMQAIIYGKTEKKRVWTPKMRRIIAILVAAALLLTGCGIIFRNEIREIFEEFFVSVSYESEDENSEMLKDVYSLNYLPEGYTVKEIITTSVLVKYKSTNQNGNVILFEQRPLSKTNFLVDSESGYSRMEDIDEYEIYYRSTGKLHYYIWTDGKYSLKLRSDTKLSYEEIVLMLNGIRTNQLHKKS